MAAEPEHAKPNVLWILTDDHRYDSIRAFNQMLHGREMSELGYVESPNTDRLAKMGTTFINTYCHAQGCAPSRASMHYGRYPFRSGVYEFEYHNNNAEHCRPTLPQRMAEIGYQTTHFGKLGVRLRSFENGRSVKPKIYQTDIDSNTLSDQGMTEWGKVRLVKEIDGHKLAKPIKNLLFLKTDSGKTYYISEQLEKENPQFAGMAQEAFDKFDLLRKSTLNKPATVFTSGILAGISPREAGKTRDGFYTSAFEEYLNNKSTEFKLGNATFDGVDPSKPLFCHIGFDFPHTPVLPPADYRDRFRQHHYNVPQLGENELETMPKQLKRQVMASYSDNLSDEDKQRMVQDYFAFCAYGDDLVGKSADAFIEYSEQNNRPWVMVYVCGDHGWKLNDHGAYSKFTPWNVDSQDPIIVVSSDKTTFPAGKVVTDYTEFVDIAPTILAAAGVDLKDKINDYLDGYDLAQVASGEIPARDYVIGESHAVTGPRAYIRTKEFVLSMQTRPTKRRGEDMEWARNASWKELDPALYDMTKDPHELNNLAFNPEYETIAQAMKKKLMNIVLGDNRVEVEWGPKADGTKLFRSNFAPGADDKKLEL
ncbi:sulfatase-like hydrolase/transferase [Novipirellula sp. SH528]|uniref:sulfatase-like hydrolase/transferase n=1 Tax=Novipirellula sp. SH528 TaxID=3454466 RepID=UPI003FA0905B